MFWEVSFNKFQAGITKDVRSSVLHLETWKATENNIKASNLVTFTLGCNVSAYKAKDFILTPK